MLVAFGWFTERGPLFDATQGLKTRLLSYLMNRSSPDWARVKVDGPGWGIFATGAGPGAWRWQQVAATDAKVAVSVGLPVGLAADRLERGPLALAESALTGKPFFDDVVPPFGLVAADRATGQFAVVQDWLGMAPLYTYRSQGVIAFSNRPMMLPYVLGDELTPDADGWAYYLGGDAFNANSSPVRGVAQLPAGKVITGRRRGDGCWDLTTAMSRTVDDLVVEASASLRTDSIEVTADGIRRAGASLGALWPGYVPLGLSGGKDSRLVSAALLSGGIVPRFSTRADTPAEAETASRLVELARSSRGLEIQHTITPGFTPGVIAQHPLVERTRQLLIRHDCGFGSTYVLRPPVGLQWPATLPTPTVGGAAGEIATSKWVPATWSDDEEVGHADVVAALHHAIGHHIRPAWQTLGLRRRLDVLVDDLATRAKSLELRGANVVHWTYLVTRMRRWSTAGFQFHQITPLLTPEFIRVAFAMNLADKREATTHRALTEHLMPEWAGIPWIKNSAGMSRAQIPQVWDGDGMAAIEERLSRSENALTGMLHGAALNASMARAKAGKGTAVDNAALRGFILLSVASDLFAEMNGEVRRFAPEAMPYVITATSQSPAPGLSRRLARVTPAPVRRAARLALARYSGRPLLLVPNLTRQRRRGEGQGGSVAARARSA